MKITKELKYVDFEYDEEDKVFTIIDTEHGGSVELNKVYAFAFMRFVVRMAQRNWLRSSPKKETKDICELAEHPFEDPNQIEFCYDEN
tara:strand:+ start:1129 stop:1392 length:264 start_codon:yes stop_codon:yes gene_type:complete